MAKPALLLLSAILVSLNFSSFLSRSLPDDRNTTTTTSVLDVSASLRLAKSILSFNPNTQNPPLNSQAQFIPTSLNSSISISLELRTRDAFLKTHHKDYNSLVLSRLRRDSARVAAITARVQLAVDGVSKSDLTPLQTEIQPQDLSTPVTSGTSHGSGEYFSRVGVGSPANPYFMVLDTGSDVSWLQCQPCTDCYEQSDPIFNPTTSSTFSPLSCQSQQCSSLEMSSCGNGQCLYQVNYGDGSFTYGQLVTETVSFGTSGTIQNVAIGCGRDNEGLFVGSAGLLGHGGGPLSLTSQIKASSFSYCLVNRDSAGSSTLDFNAAQPGDSVVAPLLRNRKIDTFYYVGLTGMSVGGQMVSIPPSVFELDESGDGGVIVDCGTAITRLQTEAYDSLRDAFVGLTQDLTSTSGVALFDTCYDLSGQGSSVRVPTVSFHFAEGKSWNLPAANYLIPLDSSGTYCFAFAPTSSSLSIIGNVQQEGTRVTFDLANNGVGFSSNKC